MTEEDVREVLMLIDANSYSDFKVTSIEATTRVWLMSLQDYPADKIMFALREYFKTGGHFAPKPSDLIEILNSSADFGDMNEIEVTNQILKALRNSSYNSVAEFNKLSPIAQRVVGGPSTLEMWAKDEKFNLGVIQSNLERVSESAIKQERNYRRMSPAMKMLADGYRDQKPQIDMNKTDRPLITAKEVEGPGVSEEKIAEYTARLREALSGNQNM